MGEAPAAARANIDGSNASTLPPAPSPDGEGASCFRGRVTKAESKRNVMTFETGSESQIQAVAISGSPSARSKSRRLLEAAVTSLARQGVLVSSIDLFELPADALLARTRAAAVDDALAAVSAADIV